jgi:ATP-binding protein involved in chromosome partitioning
VALIDARKGLAMFRKVDVPVLGIVENMSTFFCPSCGHETHVFRSGGGERTAKELGVPFLGSLPLEAEIAEGGDAGVPIVAKRPDGPHAAAFRRIAESVTAALAAAAR